LGEQVAICLCLQVFFLKIQDGGAPTLAARVSNFTDYGTVVFRAVHIIVNLIRFIISMLFYLDVREKGHH
jgi:hypothetical protein